MYKKITKQSLKTSKTKDKIIKASLTLMRERGYDNTSIRDICEKAKVTTGSFYNIFDSKEELLGILFDDARNRFSNYQIDYKKDKVEKIGDEYIRMIKEMLEGDNGQYFDNFCQVVFLPKEGNKLFFDNNHPAKIFLVKTINEFKKSGKIKNSIDTFHVADLLIIALMGAMYYARGYNDRELCYKVLEETCYPILENIKK